MTDDAREARVGAASEGGESGQTANTAGSEAIKWGAIVIIVLAILYFLARYVIPLF
ncbi:MAG: hypothetical protein IMX00_08060 [Limnochordales bacterium]|nr:hypothetical protein [Limnochordales bacterium]